MTKQQAQQTVKDYIRGEGWKFQEDEDGDLKCSFNIGCKLKSCRVHVFFRDTSIGFFTVSPINADTNNLGQMLEYLARANYGLRCGNFECDVRDGEVRYKTFLPYAKARSIPHRVVERNFDCGFQMMKKYGDGIAALAMGFSDAKTEIDKAEG